MLFFLHSLKVWQDTYFLFFLSKLVHLSFSLFLILVVSRRGRLSVPDEGQQPQQQLWVSRIYDNLLPACESSALRRKKYLQLFHFPLPFSLPLQAQLPRLCLQGKRKGFSVCLIVWAPKYHQGFELSHTCTGLKKCFYFSQSDEAHWKIYNFSVMILLLLIKKTQ